MRHHTIGDGLGNVYLADNYDDSWYAVGRIVNYGLYYEEYYYFEPVFNAPCGRQVYQGNIEILREPKL